MGIDDTLLWAFIHHYHNDLSNAATHCAPVRYSPLTFRLALAIDEERDRTGDSPVSREILPEVYAVLLDRADS